MENDIAPKLEKLKREKADFLTFQKIEGEVERLRQFMIAYDYFKNLVFPLQKRDQDGRGIGKNEPLHC